MRVGRVSPLRAAAHRSPARRGLTRPTAITQALHFRKMETDKKGKTLWEMLQERLHGGSNGAGIAFDNPLDLRVGSPVNVPAVNGPELAKYDFTVEEIREYSRRLSGQDFIFTDYVLRGVDTKSFDANQTITARLRTVPNAAGAHDSVLLQLYDEFAFAED